jgi:hypothetical protein
MVEGAERRSMPFPSTLLLCSQLWRELMETRNMRLKYLRAWDVIFNV